MTQSETKRVRRNGTDQNNCLFQIKCAKTFLAHFSLFFHCQPFFGRAYSLKFLLSMSIYMHRMGSIFGWLFNVELHYEYWSNNKWNVTICLFIQVSSCWFIHAFFSLCWCCCWFVGWLAGWEFFSFIFIYLLFQNKIRIQRVQFDVWSMYVVYEWGAYYFFLDASQIPSQLDWYI